MGLKYNNIDVGDRTKISPSSFSSFYENPISWYNKNISKEEVFRGNQNTVIGSLIHNRIEHLWKNEPIDRDEEFEYLEQWKEDPSINEWNLMTQLDTIWKFLPDMIKDISTPDSIEQEVRFDIPNSNYTLAGSYDYVRTKDKVIGDIKTASSSTKNIHIRHYQQVLLYELCRRYNGLEPMDTMEVIYIVKPKIKEEEDKPKAKPNSKKDTPPVKVIVLQEPITNEDIEYMKNEVKNMITRIELVKNNPSLKDVVFFYNKSSYIK